ncbi:hypothetical protein HNQ02_000682 [Flavobacterium sp. 7E]|uniref:hypothetical protein n=1 Tax=Flavobacterium sp. 7E TaxID=2735898 RepID=UPI00156F4A6D|nr:hypothetical protein [Flavobacterium sp. 7E]NRS87775.1 hypothetical protein [Flavobacterium sp. 7E]
MMENETSTYSEKVALLNAKIDALLELMYPNDFKEKGIISFQNGIYKGVSANLYDICIIDFDASFVAQNSFFQDSYSETIDAIKTNYNYEAQRSRLYINNGVRNYNGAMKYNFDDTNEGLELKAAHIVFAFEVALKTIEKRLTVLV